MGNVTNYAVRRPISVPFFQNQGNNRYAYAGVEVMNESTLGIIGIDGENQFVLIALPTVVTLSTRTVPVKFLTPVNTSPSFPGINFFLVSRGNYNIFVPLSPRRVLADIQRVNRDLTGQTITVI